MSTRKSKKAVTFGRPLFVLGLDEVLPADARGAKTHYALRDHISVSATRRISPAVHLYTKFDDQRPTQTLATYLNEVAAALKGGQAIREISLGRDISETAPKGTREPPREETEREAIERGENEGMSVHSE